MVAANASTSGKLTYQWYSNTKKSTANATLIEGANAASYSIPATLPPGTTQFYFCEVRANGAIPVFSDVAKVIIIPREITITTHPAANTPIMQGSTATLTIAASVSPSTALSYQWYKNTTNSNSSGTRTPVGTNAASYSIPATLSIGQHYYYCVVSAANATSRSSNVATVTVSPTGSPVITIETQPVGKSVLVGSITGDLNVVAKVTPSAPLTYQWYYYYTSPVEPTPTPPAPMSATYGGTSATMEIPKSMGESTVYFYCTVSSSGAAPISSSVATVKIMRPFTCTSSSTPAVILTELYVGQTVGGYAHDHIAVSGGTKPYKFNATDLPPGIQINTSTSLISGSPTTANPAVKIATLRITDSSTPENQSILPIQIGPIYPQLTITGTYSLPPSVVGRQITPITIVATGGKPPLSFTIQTDRPAGIKIDPNSGKISGSPITTGPAGSFTVGVYDKGNIQQAKFITVNYGAITLQ